MAKKNTQENTGFFERMFKREPSVEDTVPWGIKVAASWSWRLLVIAGLLAVLGFIIIELRFIVIPMLIALLIVALLMPIVDFLHRHKWPRILAVFVTELGFIAIITGLIFLVITQVRAGFNDLVQRSEVVLTQVTDFLKQPPISLTQEQIDGYLEHLGELLEQDWGVILSGAMSIGSSVGNFFAGLLIVLFAVLFLLLDGRRIWSWILNIVPRTARRALDGGAKAGWISLENYIKVQVLVAVIDAIGIAGGAAILGVPLAFPIAVLVFLFAFVPTLGAIISGAVAVFIALVYNGWVVALIMLIIVIAVQQLENHVFQPLVIGNVIQIHPLGVVLSVMAGTMIAGIPGALFAVPLVAMTNSAIKYIASGKWRVNDNPTVEDVINSDKDSQ